MRLTAEHHRARLHLPDLLELAADPDDPESREAVGTINGVWSLCGSFDLFIWDPLGLGLNPELYGNPGVIETQDGKIFTMSYGSVFYHPQSWDWLAFGGITKNHG